MIRKMVVACIIAALLVPMALWLWAVRPVPPPAALNQNAVTERTNPSKISAPPDESGSNQTSQPQRAAAVHSPEATPASAQIAKLLQQSGSSSPLLLAGQADLVALSRATELDSDVERGQCLRSTIEYLCTSLDREEENLRKDQSDVQAQYITTHLRGRCNGFSAYSSDRMQRERNPYDPLAQLVSQRLPASEIRTIIGTLAPGTVPTAVQADAIAAFQNALRGSWCTSEAVSEVARLMDNKGIRSHIAQIPALARLKPAELARAAEVAVFVDKCHVAELCAPGGLLTLQQCASTIRECDPNMGMIETVRQQVSPRVFEGALAFSRAFGYTGQR
jgi:hypothetical protein